MSKGQVRFEKRIIEHGRIKNNTPLGSLKASDDWPLFCELSAFGIQETTSAAAVAEQDCFVRVIPVEILFEFLQGNSQYYLQFFSSVTRRLATMLRNLHTRQLNLSSLSQTKPGHRIHNEAVIFSWPCNVKSGLFASDGLLLISRSYLSFVKQKEDKKGMVSDAAQCASHIIKLEDITELNASGSKVLIRDSKDKLTITLKKDVSMVVDVINTAKKALKKNAARPSSPIRKGREGTVSMCVKCRESYCVYCQCLPATRNSCSKTGGPHKFNEGPEPAKPTPCGRCGSEGLHIFPAQDLRMLLEKFTLTHFKPGEQIQAVGTKVDRIGYVLEGSATCTVVKEDGQELKLNDVVSGETIGDIGAFMDTPSSATLSAGDSGCSLLEIPIHFIFENSESEFRMRVYFALVQLMWSRITTQEQEQVKMWMKKIEKSGGMDFLSESLLREGTGKKIDERGEQGWY